MELKCQHTINAFSKENVPVMTVKAPAQLCIHTLDCYSNLLRNPENAGMHVSSDLINPATGPIYVDGCQAGDTLKVTIKKIDVENLGVASCSDDCGPLAKFIDGSHLEILEIKDNKVDFLGKYEIPLHKMIGVIGVAPNGKSIPCGTPGAHGGNMDNTRITKGATLYLPVFNDGAYFACGDVHACMGDGEIMVSGVEIGAKVTIKFDVIKGVSISEPRLEDENYIYTISSNEDIEKAIYSATKTMNEIIQKHLGYSFNEAGMLLSATGYVQICQVVDPERTVSMRIPKSVCKDIL